MKRSLCLVLAALLGTSLLGGSGDGHALSALGRNLIRPVFLPFLWQKLQAANSPEEYAAQGRLLLRLLPHWTDGHILMASTLAFDASLQQSETTKALDRVQAALEMLEHSLQQQAPRPEEILTAMFTILEGRCRQDAQLAQAFQQRFAQDPVVVADRYLARAIELHPSQSLQDSRCYLQMRLIASALRSKDLHSARQYLAATEQGLTQVRDQQLAQEYQQALQLLRRHLQDAQDVKLMDLQRNPHLHDIALALGQAEAGNR